MGDNHKSVFLTSLDESTCEGEAAIMLHLFSGSKKVGSLVLSQGHIVGSDNLSLDMSEALRNYIIGKPCGLGGLRVFELAFDYCDTSFRVVGEILEAPPQLVIFGAGHVGQAVAMIGALAGYDIIVVDDRVEFLTRERFPARDIKLVEAKYYNVKSHIRITKNTAIVIVTRGHQFDEICLEQVLGMDARYVGMIGSRRRVLSIFKRLEASGVSKLALESVHAPVGLKIGAVSPQEIAVAIVAEIISVMSGQELDDRLYM